MKRLLLALLGLVISITASADQHGLIMQRSTQTFPETMLALQTSITEHGYTVSRVQRVDIGLTKFGYKTDKYRVVFFGKASEIRAVKQSQPQLIPYLPLKVVIFSEGNETMLVTTDVRQYATLSDNQNTKNLFERWNNDVRSILSDVR